MAAVTSAYLRQFSLKKTQKKLCKQQRDYSFLHLAGFVGLNSNFVLFVYQATPTLLRRFGGRVLQEEILSARSSLRVLALGGEVCPSLFLFRSWRQAGNKTRIYNLYGTTEVSCWACCYKLPDNLLSSDHM